MTPRAIRTLLGTTLLLAGTLMAQAAVETAGQLLIDLHISRGVATNASGSVNYWTNFGTVTGVFANDGDSSTYPTWGAAVGGQPAVSFDGGDRLRASFATPDTITGAKPGLPADDYSIEVWAYNPALVAEECMLSWARRGTSTRAAQFNFGNNGSYGAVTHWDAADMGWNPVPTASAWHHLVVTYDGATERLYLDGVANATEAKTLNIWNGDLVTLGSAYSMPPGYGQAYSGSLLAVRIHSGVLTPTQIANNYAAGMTAAGTAPAQITLLPVTAIQDTTATVNGQLALTTGPTDVKIFYGTTDGDVLPTGWAGNVSAGQFTDGAFSANLTGLSPTTTYIYRCYASNATGEAWSGPLSFRTTGRPEIANLAPKGVTVSTAYLRGNVIGTNGSPTQVKVFWGPTDGGADPASWMAVEDLGTKPPGELAAPITGLTADTTYYYRYYATNASGETWASASVSFTTPRPFNYVGFNYAMQVTFSGYTASEPLFNFPVLVVLNAGIPGFNYGQFFSGTADLRFASVDGAELNYEIESWDPSGNSYVWVQVPALTPGASIYMIWGSGGLSVPAYTLSGATWSDGFAAVWHMTNKYVKDSTGHGWNGASIRNPAAVSDTPGMIGTGQDYNTVGLTSFGTTVIANGGDIDLSAQTLSAWVWLRDASRDGAFMAKDGVMFFWQQGGNLRFETAPWGGDTVRAIPGTGQWIYLTATAAGDGSVQAIYTNGVLAGGPWTKGVPGLNNNNFTIGGGYAGSDGRAHNGKLDELRAESVTRSAAWIRACYDNQFSPAGFETFGTVTRIPGELLVGKPVVTDLTSNQIALSVWVNTDNGNGVESWGTVLGDMPDPTGNALGETGYTNAPFQFLQTRTALTPGGHYYLRGYANNSIEGTKYSPQLEFYAEPTEATGLVISEVTNVSARLSWTPGAGSAGTLVLVRENAAITLTPADGTTYAANRFLDLGADLGGGTYAVYAGADSTVTMAGLVPGKTYYVKLFAYAGAGALINYQEDTPAADSLTTLNTIDAGLQVAGALLIDLSAGRGLEYDATGQVTNWINFGAAGGSFAMDGLPATCPVFGLVQDQVSVTFDGADHLRGSFLAPAQITGRDGAGQPDDYTIEMWVFNPSIAAEEWVFSWAKRGTTARCAAVGYGSHATWGAIGHWGAADAAFSGGVPPAGLWHHVVAVYDGVNNYIYVDGALNTTKANALDLWDGGPVILGDQFNDQPFSYANIPYSGSLAGLRVHSRALSASQVATNYLVGMPPATGPIIVLGQPQNASASEYAATAFAVSAVGAPPIFYQWYSNDVAIAEGTRRTLVLSGLSTSASGAQFYCILSNYVNGTANVVTSSVATLTVQAVDATLAHRYSFTADAQDSVGTAHGSLVNGATIVGGAVVLDGINQYVDLPNGLVAGYNNITVEAWLIDNTVGNWARLWDFGNSSGGEDFPIGAGPVGTQYMFVTPQSSWGGSLRGSYTVSGGGAGEQTLENVNTRLPAGVLKQVVWTSDAALHTGLLYVDGLPVATNLNLTVTPAMMGITSNNWLGRSQFGADFFLQASITEFRLYNEALPPAKVRQSFLLGPEQRVGSEPWMVGALPANRTNNLGTSASFTIEVATCVPLFYQWYLEGFDLIDETNATLIVPDVQDYSVGTYSVTVWDINGSEITNASAVLSINNPPVAADDLIGAGRDLAVTFPAALLVINDTDPNNDPLAVSGVNSPSANGGTVVLAGGNVTYTPPAGFTGADSFAYTVSDALGATATATVQVTVVEVTHKLAASFTPAGQPSLNFSGIPYRAYRIQYSEDLQTWSDLATIAADAAGLIVYEDPTTPVPAKRFYKAVSP